MIEHAWTVLCRKAIVDPQTNNATLVETVEQINATGVVNFPTLAPMQMELVSLWYRSDVATPARGQGRVTFLGPDGHETVPAQVFSIDLSAFVRVRSIAQLPGLPVTGPGMYYFQIAVLDQGNEEWRNVGRVPVQIAVQGNQEATPPARAEAVH
jgi:hypothetical protein